MYMVSNGLTLSFTGFHFLAIILLLFTNVIGDLLVLFTWHGLTLAEKSRRLNWCWRLDLLLFVSTFCVISITLRIWLAWIWLAWCHTTFILFFLPRWRFWIDIRKIPFFFRTMWWHNWEHLVILFSISLRVNSS